jgi:hypothetical protein
MASVGEDLDQGSPLPGVALAHRSQTIGNGVVELGGHAGKGTAY